MVPKGLKLQGYFYLLHVHRFKKLTLGKHFKVIKYSVNLNTVFKEITFLNAFFFNMHCKNCNPWE